MIAIWCDALHMMHACGFSMWMHGSIVLGVMSCMRPHVCKEVSRESAHNPVFPVWGVTRSPSAMSCAVHHQVIHYQWQYSVGNTA